MSTDTEHRLLIVEDDPGLQQQMRWCFDEGVTVHCAGKATDAEAVLRKEQPQVVTLDLGLPPDPGGATEGFALLEKIGTLLPNTKVIVITGREDRENALQSVNLGAYDFYQKPIDSDTLRFVVERAFKLSDLEEENLALKESSDPMPLKGVIAASDSMLKVCKLAERVAPTSANVMILGETGTGKEVFAKAIHNLSERSDEPMVVINCAAIPENLLESELFGHEKGSFTGAVGRKIGKIEAASGGTLFLDEIGDMALPLQAKILRFLQERVVERVGGNTSIPVDVRVISATHRPLKEMIETGDFREDLFFRLSEVSLTLPALRERDADSVLLARRFLAEFAEGRKLSMSQDAVAAITGWKWPGNVRELENRVKRACILADGNRITAVDLELDLQDDDQPDLALNLKTVREDAERKAINAAVARAEGNLSQAARLLGVSRPTLYNLINKLDLSIDVES